MTQRAAAIVMKDNKILLMYRRRNGFEYYAVPGGHIENGEKPEIRITAIDFDGRVRIRVSDNGIGIPDDRTSAVFEPFLRLHQPHRYPGTGLGLALVKDICHQMGGTCGVESEPGKGSTFWVELASEPLETAIADVTLDHIA